MTDKDTRSKIGRAIYNALVRSDRHCFSTSYEDGRAAVDGKFNFWRVAIILEEELSKHGLSIQPTQSR